MTTPNDDLATVPGASSFFGAPIERGLDALEGTIAVVGAPYDLGVGYRPGARFGPRAIRDASMRLAPASNGVFDLESGCQRLTSRRLVDAGDVAVLRSQPAESLAAIEGATTDLLAAGAFPVIIGGDHSITGATVRALAERGSFGILQLDAHLDLTDRVAGSPDTSSSPMRRAGELAAVGTIVQVGIRGPRTASEAYEHARQRGNVVVTREQYRSAEGQQAALDAVAAMDRCYVTLDMDVFDPAIAPGVSSPEPDGLAYRDVRALLARVADITEVVAIDIVETNPLVDPGGDTAYLAAVAALEFLAALVP